MDETTAEHWRWIPGYANRYEVSDSGRVRSHLIPRPGYSGELPRLLSVTKTSTTGRMATTLRNAEGLERKLEVHRLVLLAFVGPCPGGMEGCHNDGDPTNNRVSNLRWDTRAANAADRSRHGRSWRASEHITHCVHGHELTPENTYLHTRDGYPRRRCKQCVIAEYERRKARRGA